MSSVLQPDFPRLIPFDARRDYVTWARNVENYLAQNDLSDTIVSGSNCSKQEKAQALFYIHLHLNEDFKNEYMLERDPLVIWQSLKDRFDRMKAVELPRAKLDWDCLHFSNFDSVTAYDSALRRIVSQLKLCDKEITDEEMIEKTLSTSPPRGERPSGAHEKSKCQTSPEGVFQKEEKTGSEWEVELSGISSLSPGPVKNYIFWSSVHVRPTYSSVIDFMFAC
ncbi:unnamed protein product [Miscanthus lutarioriparius]|uniref:Uncharacterized protein n=1 Tax=Miscanthus lutarioriparius TaxID=422564 RepID=A0A811N7S8_9POAL|nr:unnamed protein product [Miscanthus lutarioriparius]